MVDKKALILQSAVALFAAKGYHQTTIQDIADEAGIAKGGIYFYYKSKEDLLLSAVTDYYDRMFNRAAEAAERYGRDPREGLVQQIMSQFQDLHSSTSLMSLFSRGQIDVNAEVRSLLVAMRGRFLVWYRDQIIVVYGPRIEPYAFDLAALLTSLIREYMGFIFMDGAALPPRRLAETIVARLDDAARGVWKGQEPPILTTAFIKAAMPGVVVREGTDAARRLDAALDALPALADEENSQRVRVAVDVLKEEAGKPFPRRVVLDGMLLLLEQTYAGAAMAELGSVRSIIEEFNL